MTAALLYFAGSLLFAIAGLLFLKGSRRRKVYDCESCRLAAQRIAWFEARYGLDQFEVFIDGTAVPVTDPMQTRPVRRG